MKKSASNFAMLLVACGLAGLAAAQDLVPGDDALLQALEQFDRLEQARNNTDMQLAEPLLQIASQYRARGRFADAHAALDRGMQIVRINNGLYSNQQLPFLEGKIENYADWGDWESARELLEHLMWLHRTKTRFIDQALLDDLMDVSRFHLRGISEDSLEFQSYHFRRALSANWLAVGAAERLWSATDRRLVPMLYGLIKQYHLQTIAVNRGGRTGYELRQIVPGTDWLRERSEMRLYFYETGQRIFNQLEEIYSAEGAVDAEAIAMIRLYRADWQLIHSRDEQALESYRQAFDGLVAANVSAELVNQYLATPAVLPVSDFYESLDNALIARVEQPDLPDQEGLELDDSALYFAEWSNSFPYASSPLRDSGAGQLDSNFALFSLNLSGPTEISRWLSSRTIIEFGNLIDATLLHSDQVSVENRGELRQRLNWLQFRPRLVDGSPEQSSATLLYQQAPAPRVLDF